MKSQLTVVGLGGSLAEHPSSLAALKNRITRRADGGAKTDLLNIRQLSLPMHHPGTAVEVRNACLPVGRADRGKDEMQTRGLGRVGRRDTLSDLVRTKQTQPRRD